MGTDSKGDIQQVDKTATVRFVDNTTQLGPEDCEVLCARAIQSSTDTDDQVAELLYHGKQDDAVAVKKQSVQQLEQSLTQLEGTNHERLTRCSNGRKGR